MIYKPLVLVVIIIVVVVVVVVIVVVVLVVVGSQQPAASSQQVRLVKVGLFLTFLAFAFLRFLTLVMPRTGSTRLCKALHDSTRNYQALSGSTRFYKPCQAFPGLCKAFVALCACSSKTAETLSTCGFHFLC